MRLGFPRWRSLARVAVCAGSTLAACAGEDSVDGIASGGPVVLISIDTLRSDRLPDYGFDGVETPAIHELATHGVVFERAFAPVPLTLPSHVSAFSGLLPSHHGVHDNLGYRFDAARRFWLPALFRERGFATFAAVSAYVLRGESGVGAGFDVFDDAIALRSRGGLGLSQRDCSETIAAARRYLERSAERRVFIWLHFYEPHSPYAAREPFSVRYRDPYVAEIAAADACVGDVLALLRERDLFEPALVVLFSDHGESLGEHGELEHGVLLHRAVLQVPLLVKLPGARHAGTRRSAPVALVDVAPTVAALAGFGTYPDLDGRALFPAHAPPETRTLLAETHYPRLHFGWSAQRSVIRFPHHLLLGPEAELYDLTRDPGETANLAADEPGVVARLRRHAPEREIEAPLSESAESRAALAALGYLGGAASAIDGPLPNPKRKLRTLAEHVRALEALARREFGPAVASLERLVAANPRMVDAWELLGSARERLGQLSEAEVAYREAARLSPGAPSPLLSLGHLYLHLGRLEEADRHAALARASSPSRAELLVAEIALVRRDFAVARAAAERVLAAGGDPAPARLALARISSAEGDLEGALAAVQRALSDAGSSGDVPAGLHLLHGDLLARRGEAELAIEAFRREIDLFPTDAAAYTRLAAINVALDRRAAAHAALGLLLERNPSNPRVRGEAQRAAAILGIR